MPTPIDPLVAEVQLNLASFTSGVNKIRSDFRELKGEIERISKEAAPKLPTAAAGTQAKDVKEVTSALDQLLEKLRVTGRITEHSIATNKSFAETFREIKIATTSLRADGVVQSVEALTRAIDKNIAAIKARDKAAIESAKNIARTNRAESADTEQVGKATLAAQVKKENKELADGLRELKAITKKIEQAQKEARDAFAADVGQRAAVKKSGQAEALQDEVRQKDQAYKKELDLEQQRRQNLAAEARALKDQQDRAHKQAVADAKEFQNLIEREEKQQATFRTKATGSVPTANVPKVQDDSARVLAAAKRFAAATTAQERALTSELDGEYKRRLADFREYSNRQDQVRSKILADEKQYAREVQQELRRQKTLENLIAKEGRTQGRFSLRTAAADPSSDIHAFNQEAAASLAAIKHFASATTAQERALSSELQEEYQKRIADFREYVNRQEQLRAKLLAEQRNLTGPSGPGGPGGPFKEAAGAANQFLSALKRIAVFSIGAGLFVRAFFGVQQAFSSVIRNAIDFQEKMETASLSIAALLANSKQLKSATGEIASVAEAYPVFLNRARDIQKELVVANIETLGSLEDLQNVYIRVLAFTKDQNASDKERLELTKNILNASVLLGNNTGQHATEARQILTLERDNGQVILQSLGIKVKELRQYKEQGTLVQKLNELLRVYSALAKDAALTFEGLTTTAQVFVDTLSARAFEGTFSGLKDILRGFGDELKTLTDKGGIGSALNLNPEVLRQFGSDLADVSAKVINFLADITNRTIEFAVAHKQTWQAAGALIEGAVNAFSGFLNIADAAITKAEQLGSAFSKIRSPKIAPETPAGKSISGGIGGAITGAFAGGAAGLATGIPHLAAAGFIAGGLSGLIKPIFDAEKEQKAIDEFADHVAPRLEEIKGLVKDLGAEFQTDPKFFSVYLRDANELFKELDALSNQSFNFPEPIREKAVKQIEAARKELDSLITKLEEAQGSAKNFSKDAIAAFGDLAKAIVESNRELALAQEENKITKFGIAQGLSDEVIEVKKKGAQVESALAEEKIKIGKIVEELNSLQKQGVKFEDAKKQVSSADNGLILGKGVDSYEQARDALQQTIPLLRQQAEETLRVSQNTDKLLQNRRDEQEIIKKTTSILADLNDKIAESTAKFEEGVGKIAMAPADAVLAQVRDAEASVEELRQKIINDLGSTNNLPTEVIAKLEDLKASRVREALAKTTQLEEKASKDRIALIDKELDRVQKALEAEAEARKAAAQIRVDDISSLKQEAEENQGIYGRVNNSIEDQIRLIGDLQKANEEAIRADIDKEQAALNRSREEVDRLKGEIEKLKNTREELTRALQDAHATPQQIEGVRRGFTETVIDPQTDKTNELLANAKRSEETIRSLEASIARGGREAANEIQKLSTTVIHLNEPIANFFGNIYEGFLKGNLSIKKAFKTLKQDITGAFADAFRESIRKKLKFDIDVKDNIFTLGGNIVSIFTSALGKVGDLFTSFGQSVFGSGSGQGFLSSIFGGSGGGSGILSGITNTVGGFFDNLGSIFESGLSGISNIFGGAGGAGQAAAGAAGQAAGSFGPVLEQLPGTGVLKPGFILGPNGTPLPNPNSAGGIAGIFSGGASGGGIFDGFSGGFIGNAAADIGKSLFGLGKSKQSKLGGQIGGTVGGIAGSFLPIPGGAAIGSFIGNLLGSAIGSLFAPGRIAKEKSSIIKTIKTVIPSAKVVKEPKAAAGLREFPDENPALVALGTQFAANAKDPTQGTIIRFAAQTAAAIKKTGSDSAAARKQILELAKSMNFDLASGVGAINTAIGKNALSFKNFNEEVAEARKNLKKYGDTSTLSVKQLNDLATANGNTGSRIATVGEALAGVIDIVGEFSTDIDGATIANNYLADSFHKVASETSDITGELQNVEDAIRSGNTTLEEGIVVLNRFRKEAGLAAVDLSNFTIDADAIQKQIDLIKQVGESLRTGFKDAINAAVQGASKADVEKAFRKSIYTAIYNNVLDGVVDALVKAATATGPIQKAMARLGETIQQFLSGAISEDELFAKLTTDLDGTKEEVERLGVAAGVTGEAFRKWLKSIGYLNDLLDTTEEKVSGLVDSLNEAGRGIIGSAIEAALTVDDKTKDGVSDAVSGAIKDGVNAADIATAFKQNFYNSLLNTVADAFVEGIVKGALASGPLKRNLALLDTIISGFIEGKVSPDQFKAQISNAITAIKPDIERLAQAIGITGEELYNAFKEAGVLIGGVADQVEEIAKDAAGIADTLRSAASSAFVQGIIDGQSSAEVAAAIRKDFYRNLVGSVADAFINGVIQGALASGPIKVIMDLFSRVFESFGTGKISKMVFFDETRTLFKELGPLIQVVIDAIGEGSQELAGIVSQIDFLRDAFTDSSNNIADSGQNAANSFDEAAAAAERAAEEAKQIAHELRQAAKALLLDNQLSPLKPAQRLTQAQETFEQVRAQALAGDPDAARRLPQAGRDLLTEARTVFASGEKYEKIFDFVRGALLDVANKFGPITDVSDVQLRTLKEIRAELEKNGAILQRQLATQERFTGILSGLVGTYTPPNIGGSSGGTGGGSGGGSGSGGFHGGIAKQGGGYNPWTGGAGGSTQAGVQRTFVKDVPKDLQSGTFSYFVDSQGVIRDAQTGAETAPSDKNLTATNVAPYLEKQKDGTTMILSFNPASKGAVGTFGSGDQTQQPGGYNPWTGGASGAGGTGGAGGIPGLGKPGQAPAGYPFDNPAAQPGQRWFGDHWEFVDFNADVTWDAKTNTFFLHGQKISQAEYENLAKNGLGASKPGQAPKPGQTPSPNKPPSGQTPKPGQSPSPGAAYPLGDPTKVPGQKWFGDHWEFVDFGADVTWYAPTNTFYLHGQRISNSQYEDLAANGLGSGKTNKPGTQPKTPTNKQSKSQMESYFAGPSGSNAQTSYNSKISAGTAYDTGAGGYKPKPVAGTPYDNFSGYNPKVNKTAYDQGVNLVAAKTPGSVQYDQGYGGPKPGTAPSSKSNGPTQISKSIFTSTYRSVDPEKANDAQRIAKNLPGTFKISQLKAGASLSGLSERSLSDFAQTVEILTGQYPAALNKGGIVTAGALPAVLHGPEAVIPLPYKGAGLQTSSPELLSEIRAMRSELASRGGGDGVIENHIEIDSPIYLGEVKMGEFVTKTVQKGIDRQTIRMPQKATPGYK